MSSDKANHWLYFLWRTRPMLDSFDDRNTKTSKFTIFGRFVAAPVHWWDTFYQPGT